MKIKQLVVVMAAALLAPVTAHAVLCETAAGTLTDLTAGGSATLNNAIVTTTDSQSTGTGVIQSFVRISTNDNCEQGYNTNVRPLEFDENNSPSFTRNLTTAAVPIVTIGGVQYREFLLDINQQSANPLLSLEQIEIYQHNDATLTGYNTAPVRFGLGLAPIWSLDGGANRYILLNYNLNSGSGSGDLFLYVPNSVFGAQTYVTLFSRFGDHNANNDGFEEWAVRTTTVIPPGEVPEPTTVWLLGLALLGAGVVRWRSSRA